jgi:hypothetical protein
MFHLGPYTLRFSKFNLKVLKTSCVGLYIYIYIYIYEKPQSGDFLNISSSIFEFLSIYVEK